MRRNLQGTDIRTRKGPVKVTLRIGMAVNDPSGGETAKQIIARADQALYHIKKTGRDGVCLWSPEDA
ncbi:MAG: diguanylate cyclase [Woeseiaceae bacterium]|nr:diguanylate cyclase [Woeseiaceae bacterium]